MNRTGYDQCFDCPAGYYCTNAMEPLLCSKGYYCPGNTTADLSPCPRGTYNPILGRYIVTSGSVKYFIDKSVITTHYIVSINVTKQRIEKQEGC